MVIAILRIVSFYKVCDLSRNVSWLYVVPYIYTEIEMHYSLISATIPSMHIFLKNFNTGYLGTTADQVDPTASMVATKGSNSYAMSSVRSRNLKQTSNMESEKHAERDLRLAPGRRITTSRVVHDDNAIDSGSINSDGSDRIIIQKTVQVDWSRNRK